MIPQDGTPAKLASLAGGGVLAPPAVWLAEWTPCAPAGLRFGDIARPPWLGRLWPSTGGSSSLTRRRGIHGIGSEPLGFDC